MRITKPLLINKTVLTLGGDAHSERYAVGSGFLEVTADGLIRIWVERAVSAADVDAEAAKKELAEAAPKLAGWKGSPRLGGSSGCNLVTRPNSQAVLTPLSIRN